MSLSNKVEEMYKKKSKEKTSKEEIADLFNNSSEKLIRKFMHDVDLGLIELRDSTDLARLFQIFMQINNLGEESGEGRLPEMTKTQQDVFSDLEVESTTTPSGEEQEFVDLSTIASMSEDEIDKLLTDREIAMNRDNEQSI